MGKVAGLAHIVRRAPQLAKTHSASILSIGVRGITVLAGFAIALLIGAKLGAEALGVYALITQTGMFLSIVAVGGLDLSIVRYFPVLDTERRYSRRSLVNMLAICLAISVGIALVVFSFGPHYLALFDEVEAGTFYLTVLSLIFLSRAFTRTTSAFLRSQRLYVFSQVVEGLLIPIPVLALIALGWISTVEAILLATALTGLGALLIGALSSVRLTSRDKEALTTGMRALFVGALPLWGVAIVKNFSDWYSLTVVGSQLSVADAGLYRLAWQITSALPIITVGIFGVFSPQIGTAAARGATVDVAQLARTATRLSVALALPAILFVAALSPFILGFVGPEFHEAQTALLILLAGQMIYVVTGPSGIVLAIMGKQVVNLYFAIAAFGLLLFTIPLAALHYGLNGVAFAIAIVTGLQNIGTFLAVRLLLGIQVWTGSYHDPQTAQGASR